MFRSILFIVSMSVCSISAYAEYYHSGTVVVSSPTHTTASNQKLDLKDAEPMGQYKNLFYKKGNKDKLYGMTEEGELHPVSFLGSIGFSPSDNQGFFSVETLQELEQSYRKWLDGEEPPSEAQSKTVKNSLEKLPKNLASLKRLQAPRNKVFEDAEGNLYTQLFSGQPIQIKPMDEYSTLVKTDQGIFGMMSDGSYRKILLDKNSQMIRAENANKGTQIQEKTLDQYSAYFLSKKSKGELSVDHMPYVSTLNIHKMLSEAEQEQGENPSLLVKAKTVKGEKRFILKTNLADGKVSLVPVSADTGKDGVLKRGEKEIPFKKSDVIVKLNNRNYKVEKEGELLLSQLPKGVSRQDAELIFNENHSAIEIQAVEAINRYRASLGLAPVMPAADLRPYAYKNSELQSFQGASGHPAGNNLPEIAFYGPTDAQSTVNGWIGSPAHHAIMVGGYREVGVAIYNGNSWTAVFR